MNNYYRFVIAMYGHKYRGMLVTLLESISMNTNDAGVAVFWQDIDEKSKEEIKKTYDTVEYYDTDFDFSKDPIQRISSKTAIWKQAAEQFKGERLCFLDVDTLIIKDIKSFFDKKADLIFTVKNEKFPLNTGVLLAQGENTKEFFEDWYSKTVMILSSKDLLLQATSDQYPYGGADQMSFYGIVGYVLGKTEYVLPAQGGIKAVSVPCEILNETRSVSISDLTHIIHYKGGWQPILLKGAVFNKYRSWKHSKEMYRIYMEIHKQAISRINQKNSNQYTTGGWGIIIPWYLHEKTYTLKKTRYVAAILIDYVQRVIKKVFAQFKK